MFQVVRETLIECIAIVIHKLNILLKFTSTVIQISLRLRSNLLEIHGIFYHVMIILITWKDWYMEDVNVRSLQQVIDDMQEQSSKLRLNLPEIK